MVPKRPSSDRPPYSAPAPARPSTSSTTSGTSTRRRRRRRRSVSYRRRSVRLGREYGSGEKNPRSCGAWVTRRSCVQRSLRPPGTVQPSLKYEDRGGTVNDLTPLTSPNARLAEAPRCGRGGQPLIGQSDRNRIDTLSERGRVLAGRPGRRPRPARKRRRQADDHFDRLAVGDQPGQPVEVGAAARVPGQRGERGGQHPTGVARRDPDPHRPHIHPDPHAVHPRCPVAGAAHEGLPTRCPMTCSTSSTASGIPSGSVPPPWATSSLPPPRPPTGEVAARTTSLADSPRTRAASLAATTNATRPSARENS